MCGFVGIWVMHFGHNMLTSLSKSKCNDLWHSCQLQKDGMCPRRSPGKNILRQNLSNVTTSLSLIPSRQILTIVQQHQNAVIPQPQGGTDRHFCSPQLMRCYKYRTSALKIVGTRHATLCLPTKGRPGWVDLEANFMGQVLITDQKPLLSWTAHFDTSLGATTHYIRSPWICPVSDVPIHSAIDAQMPMGSPHFLVQSDLTAVNSRSCRVKRLRRIHR